ncbi:MAG: hypothetical protein ACREA7_08610 [Nitrosotalea sp.]
MLYNKIRYAEKIRALYKLRHLLAHDKHPDIGSRLGFTKYSKQYYDVRNKLIEENILDRDGRFINNPVNVWISELPINVNNKQQLRVLRSSPTLTITLSLVFNKQMQVKEISTGLGLHRRTTYDAIKKLTHAHLVVFHQGLVRPMEDESFYHWLDKYIKLCLMQADTNDDIHLLFDCVPSYIDGKQAYYTLNYEAGRPVGPADMIIRTYEPFMKFWETVIAEVRYFKQFPKRISIEKAKKTDAIVWLNGLPYNKRARLV